MRERWKSVYETDTYYSVSSLGRIRRDKPGHGTRVGRIVAAAKGYRGYRFVSLTFNGKRKRFYVHILVARYFIGPCPSGKEVNHKDLDKGNNHWKNLEYKTHKKNIHYSIQMMGSWAGNEIVLSKSDIKNIRLTGINLVKSLAKKYKVSTSTVRRVMNRRVTSFI